MKLTMQYVPVKITMVCQLETNSVSLERVLEYSSVGVEAAWETPADDAVPAIWPDRGGVEITGLTVRYRYRDYLLY